MATLSDQVALITSKILSPVNIPLEADLETLQHIKQVWIEQARNADHPAVLWNVLYWLGVDVKTQTARGLLRTWRTPAVALVGGEAQHCFVPELKAYETFRWVAAYAGIPGQATNELDSIVLHMPRVAYWRWRMVGDEVTEVTDQLLYIPGDWISPILTANTTAQQVADEAHHTAVETQRQKLLAELLVVSDEIP